MSEIQAGVTKRTKLIAARENRGLSQEALAEEIGASRVAVNHWENGLTAPHPHYRKKLCVFFKVEDLASLDLDCASKKGETPPKKRTNLAAARVNRGLSQKALAEELKVTPVTVSNWERGHTIPFPYYRGVLCAFFGVDDPEMLDIGYEEQEDLQMAEALEGESSPLKELEVIPRAGPNPRERSGHPITLMVNIHLTVSIDAKTGVAVVEAVRINS